MSSAPKRRLLDRLSGSPTVLGAQTRFVGDLECSGPLVLSGSIKGDGQIDGPLHVAADAVWEGQIRAAQAVVAGRITGTLTIAGKLEIGRSARIQGTVTAQTLAIAQGAVIDGEVRVTGEAPVTHFEEKREG